MDIELIIKRLKANGWGIFFRLKTLTLGIITSYFILEIYSVGIRNESTMEWNLFVSINCWGGLIFLWVFIIAVMHWWDYLFPKVEVR